MTFALVKSPCACVWVLARGTQNIEHPNKGYETEEPQYPRVQYAAMGPTQHPDTLWDWHIYLHGPLFNHPN